MPWVVEAQRLKQRTMFDLEMMAEVGCCSGIENHSRHLTGYAPGEPPPTLFDYLPAAPHQRERNVDQTNDGTGRCARGAPDQKPSPRSREPAHTHGPNAGSIIPGSTANQRGVEGLLPGARSEREKLGKVSGARTLCSGACGSASTFSAAGSSGAGS